MLTWNMDRIGVCLFLEGRVLICYRWWISGLTTAVTISESAALVLWPNYLTNTDGRYEMDLVIRHTKLFEVVGLIGSAPCMFV